MILISLEKAFVRAKTYTNKQGTTVNVRSHFTKRPPAKAKERHLRRTFTDHSDASAKKAIEVLDRQIATHEENAKKSREHLQTISSIHGKGKSGLSLQTKIAHLQQDIKNQKTHIESLGRKKKMINDRGTIWKQHLDTRRAKSKVAGSIARVSHTDSQKKALKVFHNHFLSGKTNLQPTGNIKVGKDHIQVETKHKDTGESKNILIHKDGSIHDPKTVKFQEVQPSKKVAVKTPSKEATTTPTFANFKKANEWLAGKIGEYGPKFLESAEHERAVPAIEKAYMDSLKPKRKVVVKSPKIEEPEESEFEKAKNRSDALKGNKNAYKGGPKKESKKVVAKSIDEIKKKLEKIKDFGEKIGGARKDQWKGVTLTVNDLKDLNDREILKHVKKEKIWPKPDFEKMIQDGTDPVAAFLVKEARNSLAAKINLPSYMESKLKEFAPKYVELVENARNALSSVKTVDDVKNSFSKIFGDEHEKGVGWKISGRDPAKRYFATSKFIDKLRATNWDVIKAKGEVEKGWGTAEPWMKGIVISKMINNEFKVYDSNISGANHSPSFKTEIEAKDFAKLRYEALKDVKTHLGKIGKKNPITQKWEYKSGYYATKGHGIITDTLSSRNEVEKIVIERYKATPKVSKAKRKKFTRPQLRGVKREGEDHRKGKDISTGDFQKKFGFKGGEFGNWNTQADRQQSMNHAYDAMMDLSKVIGVNPEEISLKKDMSIAFGSRGEGFSGASAHYEPSRKVINLTKIKGAGSLAHEWSHAFDDYVMRLSGGQGLKTPYASEAMRSYKNQIPEDQQKAFKNIISTMTNKKMTLEDFRAEKTKGIETNTKWLKKTLDSVRKRLTEGDKVATKEQLKEFDTKMVPGIINGQHENEQRVPDESNKYSTSPERINHLMNVFFKGVKGHRNDDLRHNLTVYYDRIGYAKSQLSKGDKVDLPTVKSAYYKGSDNMKEFFGKKDYWTQPTEMMARAFESYIEDKLKAKGEKSQYLVHSTGNGLYAMFENPDTGEIPEPFPSGEERVKINKAFDDFFKLFTKGKQFPDVKEDVKMSKSVMVKNISKSVINKIKATGPRVGVRVLPILESMEKESRLIYR